ncbi:hypothetical protein HNQ60_004691 [Povalibacter uvarum]|uniref:UPF0311 protein HNQ60_004691 n=1 Tax=Povalibacter uvarum TaxID=732238 RepID=A0A841HUB4_9GAMM|nr:DUF3237 domain-containing protein [Povalibacter uvarum]MBB6095800.1 hypothetical protein [Povalibacter uvarum]
MPSRRHVLEHVVGSMAGVSLAGLGTASAAESPASEVRSRFAFEARVSVSTPQVVGPSSHGLRRIVPITGGTFAGPRIEGTVVPGGADWQFVRPDGVLAIEAKYTLQAKDGALIMVTNRGMRHGPPDVIAKLARGESVDPQSYYFRTTAEFEAPLESEHAWLNRAIFIGVAERKADVAIIRFYELL